MKRLTLPLTSAGFALALLAGCDAPTSLVCGAGTVRSGDLCVPDEVDEPACGPGTELDPESGACVSVTACGAGTTLNRDTNSCEPVARCGPGTELNPNSGQCVTVADCGPGTTQVGTECVTEASCGAGTVLGTTGECEAVEPCAPGTSFNATSGVCESFLVCGAGQVEIGGVCLDDVAAAADAADFAEPGVDANDPRFGGAPEALTAPVEGESATFAGVIDRPRDLNGDGALDQDLDLWSFDAQAGAWFSLRVQSNGLPQPAFVVRGPRGFERESPLGYVDEASRELFLPFDGTYTIEVVPALHVITGEPVGGPNGGYLGTLSRLAPPVAAELSLEAPGTPLAISGALLDLTDNLFSFTAADDTPVVVQLDDSNLAGTAPVVIVAMSAAGDVLSHTTLRPRDFSGVETGGWAGLVTVPGEATQLLIDYAASRSAEDAFSGRVIALPVEDLGALPTQGFTDASLTVGVGEFAALRYALDDVQVVDLGLSPPCAGFFCPPLFPEVTVAAGNDAPALPVVDDALQHLGRERVHTLFYRNLVGTTDLSLRTITPVVLDVLDAGAPSAQASGARFPLDPFTGADDQWFVVQTAEAGLVALGMERGSGIPGADVLGPFGGARRALRYFRPDTDARVRMGDDDAALVHVFSRDPAAAPVFIDWSFRARLDAPPAAAEAEPNDDVDTADDLGEAPASVRASIAQFGEDVFRFRVPAALSPGQALRVTVDVPDADDASGSDDLVQLLFLDEDGQIYDRIPQGTDLSDLDDADGVRASNTSFLLPVSAGETLFLRVRGLRRAVDLVTNVRPSDEIAYFVDLSVEDGGIEAEPNDDATLAAANNPLPALPAVVYGWGDEEVDPVDVWAFTLDAPMAAGESLLAEVLDLESQGRFALALKDSVGNVLSEATNNPRSTVQAGGLPAGDYTLEVTAPTLGASTQPPYRLDVRVAGAFEVEPNDAAAPHAIGTLAAGGALAVDAFVDGDDLFTFDLDAPLAADEHLEVEVLSLSHPSAIFRRGPVLPIALFDGADPSTAELIGAMDDMRGAFVARVSGTGPFALQQRFATNPGGRYRVVVRRASGLTVEAEPNDVAAQPLPALPVTLHGNSFQRAPAVDVDLYTTTLAAPLSGEALEITVVNTHDGDRHAVSLIDPSGNTVDTATGERVSLAAPDAVAGEWTVRVEFVPQQGFRDAFRDPNTYALTARVTAQ